MKRLLERAPHITALFAQNDRMATGAMRTLHEADDDIPAAAYSHPPLTTVRQPMQQVGRVATQRLIELIDAPDTRREEVLLKTELVRRGSCGHRRQ